MEQNFKLQKVIVTQEENSLVVIFFNFWEAHKACKSLGKRWRLPQKGELEMMYHQLHCKAIGNFTSSSYWSKSIHIDGEKERWCFSFKTGMFNVALLSKNQMYVRAVRPLKDDEMIVCLQ